MEGQMRALAILKRPMVAIPVLAGLGLIVGLVFAADRLAARITSDTMASCTLNTGKGDRCGRVFYTREQFDEVFAELEAASKASNHVGFAEKLRLAGAKRLAPSQPAQRFMMVPTRVASLDPASVMFGVDATLRTTFLDQGTIFRMLLEDPHGSASDTRTADRHPEANG
jgi:hypothetical protein